MFPVLIVLACVLVSLCGLAVYAVAAAKPTRPTMTDAEFVKALSDLTPEEMARYELLAALHESEQEAAEVDGERLMEHPFLPGFRLDGTSKFEMSPAPGYTQVEYDAIVGNDQ